MGTRSRGISNLDLTKIILFHLPLTRCISHQNYTLPSTITHPSRGISHQDLTKISPRSCGKHAILQTGLSGTIWITGTTIFPSQYFHSQPNTHCFTNFLPPPSRNVLSHFFYCFTTIKKMINFVSLKHVFFLFCAIF